MRIKSLQTEEKPTLMIIPMIDIIFFLLVFFMMSTLSMVQQKNIPVALPTAEASRVSTTKTIPVSITKDGAIFLEQQAVSVNELEKRLVMEKRNNEKVSVILRGDEAASYGRIIYVMDTVKKVGITNVSIATDGK